MLKTWMMIMFFWGSGHSVYNTNSDKQFTEQFANKTECVAHQELLTQTIERRYPSTSTMSICMTQADFDNKTPTERMHGAHFSKSE